jgi:hypothetical protein
VLGFAGEVTAHDVHAVTVLPVCVLFLVTVLPVCIQPDLLCLIVQGIRLACAYLVLPFIFLYCQVYNICELNKIKCDYYVN